MRVLTDEVLCLGLIHGCLSSSGFKKTGMIKAISVHQDKEIHNGKSSCSIKEVIFPFPAFVKFKKSFSYCLTTKVC